MQLVRVTKRKLAQRSQDAVSFAALFDSLPGTWDILGSQMLLLLLMRLMVGLTSNPKVQKESMPCHDSSSLPGLQPDLLAELLDLMFHFKAVDTVALSAALRCYGKTGRCRVLF